MEEARADDPNDRRAEFAPRFRRQLWISGTAIAAALPAFAIEVAWLAGSSIGHGFQTASRAVALGALVAALIASRGNWRCVSCGRYLGSKFLIRSCAHCGVRLR